MPKSSNTEEKKLVLLNDTVSPPKFDLFTQAEYDALPKNVRTRRWRATLAYLWTIPNIPQSLFVNSTGEPVKSISEADLSGAISLIYQKIPPVRVDNVSTFVPRMPTEIVIHWINKLQTELNKLEKAHAPFRNKNKLSSEEATQKMLLDWQTETVTSILKKQKSNLLSHNLTVKAVADSLKKDSEELYRVNLKDLGDFAYRADGLVSLSTQLPRTDVFENYQTRLNDNFYGVVFETNLMHGLVQKPPPQLYSTMNAVARGLEAMFNELPLDIVTNKLISHLEKSIDAHQRPWFDKVPELGKFLDKKISNSDKLAGLRTFLKSPVTNGYQVIAIAYLAQHLFIARSRFTHLLSVDDAQWLHVTRTIYDDVHTTKVNTTKSTLIRPLLSRSATDQEIFKPILGITNSYQPPAVPPMEKGPIHRPGASKLVNIGSVDTPEAVNNALLYGLPNITGISGTTNIFLGTLTHLKTDLGYDIDVAGAFLGLLMFLVLDGGHSIHEALLMANYRESLPAQRKYTRLNFNSSFKVTRPSVKRNGVFVSNYERFIEYYRYTPMWPSIEKAHNTAWQGTLDYFNQYSIYRDGIERTVTPDHPTLEQLFARFEQVMQGYSSAQNRWQFVTLELEKILQQRMQADQSVSRSEAIHEFTVAAINKRFNIKSYSPAMYETMVSVLIDLGYKEAAKKSLWDTLKTLPRFDNLKEDQVLRLVVDNVQHTTGLHNAVNEVGYMAGMLRAYQEMLKESSIRLSVNSLQALYNTAVFNTSREGVFRNTIDDGLQLAALLAPDYQAFLPKGFDIKDSQYSLTVEDLAKNQHGNASSAGINELLSEMQLGKHPLLQLTDYKLNSQGQPIVDSNGKVATLMLKKHKSIKTLENYVDTLIKRYHAEIKGANEADKLTAIAKLCRGLAILKLFPQHDKTIIGVLLLNKLLLQNGLPPTILENVEHLVAFSIQEIVTKIQEGQVAFYHLTRSGEGSNRASFAEPSRKKSADENAKRPPAFILPDEESSSSFDSSRTSVPQSADSVYFERQYRVLESGLLNQASEEFNDGYNLQRYQDIAIPGFDANMSVMEMQALALAEAAAKTPNARILGALVRHIMLAQTKGIDKTKVLKTLIDVSKASYDLQGSRYERAISQAIYIQAVDPDSAVLCYGLTWAVATILETNGETAVDRFAQRMYAAAEYPHARSSMLMQTVLKSLHYSANNLYSQIQQETTAFPHYTLDEIITQLEQIRGSAMYELNTSKHAMMLGVIRENFYIYDPNTLIARYDTFAEFKKALHGYLMPNRLAEYAPFSRTDGKQVFEFKKIDTATLSAYKINVEDNSYLSIANLAQEESLHTILEKQQARQVQEAEIVRDVSIENITRNNSLHLSLNELDNQKIAKNLLLHTQDIYEKNNLSTDLIPLFSKMEKSARGYRLPFVHRSDATAEVKWIDTQDAMLFSMKEYVDTCTEKISEGYTLREDFSLSKKTGVHPEVNAKSLNAAFLLQTLITWTKWNDRDSAVNNEIASNLSTAISVHGWINLTQIGQGIVHDIADTVQLTRMLIANSRNIDLPPASAFANALGHGVQGIGTLLGGIVVGLDAYEFAHAENAIQQSVFGTQFAFDVASLAMSAAGIGFGLAGFATVAGVLGPLSVPIAALGVGASALAQVYGELAEETKSVGAYFAAIDQAYKIGCQRNHDGVLTFSSGSVIQSIDLNTGLITYGSQYLYTYNYHYLSVLDSPDDNGDRSQAIAIRPALGYSENFTISQQDREAEILFLPSTVASYDSTYTQLALGFRHTQTEGDAVLAKLEKACHERFKMEYGFFFQHTVRSITHQYIPTTVKIILDSRHRTLLAPELPQQISNNNSSAQHADQRINAMTYQLDGQGGQYTVGLNKGASFVLNTTTTIASQWILDTRYLEGDEVVFKPATNGTQVFAIDDVNISVTSRNAEKVTIIKKNGTMSDIDFTNKKLLLSSIDARQWETTHQQKIQAHLQELTKFHQLAGRYTAISNYQYQDKDINIDRAYYDSKQDRMIFSYIDRSQDMIVKPLIVLIDELICSDPLALISASKEKLSTKNKLFFQDNSGSHSTSYKKNMGPTEEYIFVQLKNIDKWKVLLKNLTIKLTISLQHLNPFISELNAWIALSEQAQRIRNNASHLVSFKPLSFDTAKQFLKLDISPGNLATKLSALRQELLYPYQDTKDAQLVGIVGNNAYFYDKNKQLLWCADVITHVTNTQFVNPVENSGRRFWQDNVALYMACKSFVAEDNEPCEYVYRIDKHTITLVSVLFEQRQAAQSSVIEDLNTLEMFGGSVRVLLPYAKMQPTALAGNIPIISVTYNAFTPLIGKDKSGKQQCYWISMRGKIIKPNLPLSETLDSNTGQSLARITDDLVLAARMLDSAGQEVFYFYSHNRKALYRQAGAGVFAGFQAERIAIPDLLDILVNQNNLFSITQEGLIYQVDVAGKISLSGVNQTWLAQHADNLSTDFGRLNYKQPVLTLLGLKINDTTPLAAWYYRGKVIVTTVASVTLNFLDSDQEGRYARLFDPVSGKVYKQAIGDQVALDKAFDANLTLRNPHSILAAEELFPKAKLSSVTVLDNKLRLITDEGLIFSLDWTGEVRLTGLTQTWLNAHAESIRVSAIEQLLKVWQHNGVLVFQNSACPTWFDVATQSTIVAWDLEARDAPELVGLAPNNEIAYVWSAKKGLYHYNLVEGITEQPAYLLNNNNIRRFDKTLRIDGGKGEDVLQPVAIKDVDTIVMSGGASKDVYQIDTRDQLYNKTILIDNYDADQVEDELQIEVDNIQRISVSRQQENLFLETPQRMIVIRNVFHQAGSDYQHLAIKLSDRTSYLQTTVSELALKIESQTQKLVESLSSMVPNNAAASTNTQSTNLRAPELVPTLVSSQ